LANCRFGSYVSPRLEATENVPQGAIRSHMRFACILSFYR
jgi:hypothetical protein